MESYLFGPNHFPFSLRPSFPDIKQRLVPFLSFTQSCGRDLVAVWLLLDRKLAPFALTGIYKKTEMHYPYTEVVPTS